MQNIILEANTVPVVQYLRLGPPEAPYIMETFAPIVGSHDFTVNMAVISVNRTDADAWAGQNKSLTGHRLPQSTRPDPSGGVAGIGPQVRGLDTGQRVWGFLGTDQLGKRDTVMGGIAVDADLVALVPVSLNLAELATLPLVGITAWQALEKLGVGLNSWLFTVGGTGGVGNVVVQVIRARGVFVDAISSMRHNELLRQLGAESRFDPEPAAWSMLTGRYQAALGITGNNLWQLCHLVVPSGRLFTTPPAGIPVGFLTKIPSGFTIIFTSVQPGRTGLVTPVDLVRVRQLNPITRARFSPTEIS